MSVLSVSTPALALAAKVAQDPRVKATRDRVAAYVEKMRTEYGDNFDNGVRGVYAWTPAQEEQYNRLARRSSIIRNMVRTELENKR